MSWGGLFDYKPKAAPTTTPSRRTIIPFYGAVPSASAGDQFFLTNQVPNGEAWIILNVFALNTTTVCTIRLELVEPSGTVHIMEEQDQSGITAHHGFCLTKAGIYVPSGWTVRLLATYCGAGDVLGGWMLVERQVLSP